MPGCCRPARSTLSSHARKPRGRAAAACARRFSSGSACRIVRVPSVAGPPDRTACAAAVGGVRAGAVPGGACGGETEQRQSSASVDDRTKSHAVSFAKWSPNAEQCALTRSQQGSERGRFTTGAPSEPPRLASRNPRSNRRCLLAVKWAQTRRHRTLVGRARRACPSIAPASAGAMAHSARAPRIRAYDRACERCEQLSAACTW